MKTKVTKEEGQIIVAFTGRLDTPAAQEVNPVINPLLEEADKTIFLDCKEMTYISSSGLRIFLTLRKAAEDKGGKIIIQNINDDIRSVFMMTGFLNLFEIR
jgi:anti-sigma B factor antagonist